MAYTPLEDLLPRTNFSVYRLVRMASARALEIAVTGQSLNGHIPANQKLTTSAFEEIRTGRVVEKNTVAFLAAKEKAKRNA